MKQQFRFDQVFLTSPNRWVLYCLIAFPLALMHALIPGIFRVLIIKNVSFWGENPAEQFIVISNFVLSFLMVGSVFVGIQVVIHYYWTLFDSIRAVGAILEPHEARLFPLPCYLPLAASGNNVRFWLLLRAQAKARDSNKYYQQAYIGLIVVAQIGLLVAFVVRYLFLAKRDVDIFTVLGVYDTITIAIMLMVLISVVVRCNERSRQHLHILQRLKFDHSLLVAQDAERSVKERAQEIKRNSITTVYQLGSAKSSATHMLDQAIEHVRNFDDPVKILGLPVDQAFLFQAGGLLAGGVLSIIAQILSTFGVY